MTPAGLTPRQAECLKAIRDLTRDGVSPSYQEIGDRLGINRGNVCALIAKLVDRGALEHAHGRTRSLIIVGDTDPYRLAAMETADLMALKGRVDAELCGRAA